MVVFVGGGDTLSQSCASTPSVSRDSTQVMGGGDVPRRANTTPRRPRPNSLHAHTKPGQYRPSAPSAPPPLLCYHCSAGISKCRHRRP